MFEFFLEATKWLLVICLFPVVGSALAMLSDKLFIYRQNKNKFNEQVPLDKPIIDTETTAKDSLLLTYYYTEINRLVEELKIKNEIIAGNKKEIRALTVLLIVFVLYAFTH